MNRKLCEQAAAALFGAVLLSVASADPSDKQIQTRVSEAQPSGITLLVEPKKPSFAVNENISFSVSGSEPFYLYVFAVDSAGKSTLILPNAGQKTNKYEKGKQHRVPSAAGAFYADSPGTERVVFVATRKYVDLPAAAKGTLVNVPEVEVENAFAAKGIRIRANDTTPGVTVKRIDLKIKDPAAAADVSAPPSTGAATATSATPTATQPPSSTPAASDSARPFVSVERQEYRVGDEMNFVYGANRGGWVHLVLAEPNGKATTLRKLAVEPNKAAQFKATAAAPIGDHALYAVYTSTDTAKVDPVQIARNASASPAKGIADVQFEGEQPPRPTASVRFSIKNP